MGQQAVVQLPTQDPWALPWRSFMLDLQVRGKSRHTAISYESAGRLFQSWLLDNQRSTDPSRTTKQDVQEWMLSMDTVSSTTVHDRFCVVRVFFN